MMGHSVTKTTWVDRGWYLVTEFERSISINFRRAVTLAETHPGFIRLMDERNVLIYRNIYRPQDLLQFRELYRLIKNWKETRLYINGDEADFDLIEPGIECYCHTKLLEHSSATGCEIWQEPAFSGCLGCRRSHVSMAWQSVTPDEFPCWYAFGRLNEHQVYLLDQEALDNAAIGHLIEYQYCPLLDLKQIKAFIRQLPDRIDPRKDYEWNYAPARSKHNYSPYLTTPAILPVSEEFYHAYLKRKLL